MTMSEGDLAVAQIRFVRQATLEQQPPPKALSGALGWLRENLLSTPDGCVRIDWEYAGMGDPAWDLGYLALATDLSSVEETALLAAYADPAITIRRLRLNRLIAAALSALWFAVRMRREASPDLSNWMEPRLRQAEELAAALYPDIHS